MRLILFCMLITSCSSIFSQVKGKIIDSKTGQALPFVNIGVNSSSYGTSSDIDGNFELKYKVKTLQFSYVGYEPSSVNINTDNVKPMSLTIRLVQKTMKLNEVVINPEENPALRIIRNVIANRKINDVEKRDYSCELYNKFSFDIVIDTTNKKYQEYLKRLKYKSEWDHKSKKMIKKEKRTPEEYQKAINEEREYVTYNNKTPIMLLETYVEKKHKAPNQDKELVTASKMSGFKNPSMMALIAKVQSFSFYNSEFALQGDAFLSPISKQGLKKYFYLIEDTIYDNKDTVFVISYRPYKGKVFKGMKGIMQISTNKYAIKNVTATQADTNISTRISIKQLYKTDERNNWAPYQLLGEIDFAPSNSDGMSSESVLGRVKTYISNFDDQTKVKNREIDNIAFEIAPKAHKVDSSKWSELRPYELTEGESFTQLDSNIDSIPFSLDNAILAMKIAMTGKIPLYKVNIDLDRILNYNDFEGVRLGFGLHTNKRLSKYIQVGGYGAYGFKDKQFKYGGDINFMLSKRREIDANFAYQNDVISSGKTYFFGDKPKFLYPKYCHLFVNQMDNIEKLEGFISFRALDHFKFHVFGNNQKRFVNNEYRFIPTSDAPIGNSDTYNITEVGVNIRFAFREKFYFDGDDKFSMGTKFPIVYGKVTNGNVTSSNQTKSYMKYDLKLNHTLHLGSVGNSRITLQTGYVNGTVPYTLLFNPDGIFKQFNISSNDAFEAMRVNEFLSDRFVNVFYGHKFKPLLITKKFKPAIELIHNLGFGSLEQLDVHSNITYSTMANGYYESGARFHNLISLKTIKLGAGVFYRYGPYSLPETIDNFAFKFVLGFGLGL